MSQELDHKKIKFSDSCMATGRLLFWDHMQDQVSYILVPPGDGNIDSLVCCASIPAHLPPAINIDELMGANPLSLLGLMVKAAFAGSSKYFWPVDLAFFFSSTLCSGESLVMVLVLVKLSSSVLDQHHAMDRRE